jgi:hypothetical protein
VQRGRRAGVEFVAVGREHETVLRVDAPGQDKQAHPKKRVA